MIIWLASFALFAGEVSSSTLTFTVGLSYDSLGRIVAVQHPAKSDTGGSSSSQTCTFNLGSGQKKVSYAGQEIVSDTSYFNDGSVEEVTFHSYNGMGTVQIEFTYDVLGRLKSQHITMGSTTLYNAYSMSYNQSGFLASYHRYDGGIPNETLQFEYNDNLTLKKFKIGSEYVNYTYDYQGNLKSHTEFDDLGLFLPALSNNIYNNKNQKASWRYDSAGKLLEDDAWLYTYNTIDQVESIADRNSGFVVAQYLYDGSGERVREVVEDKVIYTIRGPGGQILTQEIHQTTEDGSMDVTKKDFIYHNGNAVATVTYYPDGSLSRNYQFRDRLGNPALVMDEETGFTPEYQEYAPFGQRMVLNPVSSPEQDFTGHEYDESTGLHYMHARYYTAQYARFTRPDPAFDFNPLNPVSYNLYEYTHNNPVNAWDPNGEDVIFGVLPYGGPLGHMVVYIQDEDGAWWFFEQYPDPRTSGKMRWAIYNRGFDQKISLRRADDLDESKIERLKSDKNYLYWKTTKDQDRGIFKKAVKMEKSQKDSCYRAWSNNCVDAVREVVKDEREVPDDCVGPHGYLQRLKRKKSGNEVPAPKNKLNKI
jgi:RHS repeat-associated protein